MTETVTYEDVFAAEPIVHRWLPRTPLYEYPLLSRRLGCQFWLKHENHQPVGAFKVRGGVNLVHSLSEEERQRGIIAVSTGNHGSSLAWACRQLGVRCTIVVPSEGNPDKKTLMRALGAQLIEYGRDFDEAKDYCEQLACGEMPFPSALIPGGMTTSHFPRYVHSANEPTLIAGVGTYALEIFEALPDPAVILVPIGLGSGICGVALVAKRRSPSTRVIGVQAEGAPAVTQSWRSGRLVTTETIATRAEGMATRAPAELTLEIMRRLVDDIVLVSESEIDDAVALLLAMTHNLAEGAGAASTAAAFKLRHELQGKKVVGVLSGGNLDLRTLPAICGRLPQLPNEEVS
ncbi:MAG: threonine dehydratase [Planctomycetes bacterium]|nr:threonine dehydratase [Planctomycetota bacterium]